MYLTPKSNQYYILDIEANSLDPDIIWCVCIKSLETQEEFLFLNQNDFNSWHKEGNVYVGHNLISFDIPILNKLWGCKIDINECVDTLILSYLYNPAMENGHSLEAWGERLKFSKGNFSDWSKLSDEMITYCKQDVNLNHKVYLALKKRMLTLGYSEVSCKIEHQIRFVINEQQANGFWFDRDRAIEFLQQLRREQSRLTDQIQRLFPRTSKLIKEGTFKYTTQGNLPAFLEKARLRYDKVVINYEDLTYAYYQDQEFNIGSPKQRVERLLALGWKPDKFTEKGFPKVDEDALVAFSTSCGEPAVQAMADWLVLQGRSSMVETWLNNLGQDSRIHGRVMTCGASTRRMIHSNPNCVPLYSLALTRSGWKSCHDLRIGEDILAYDLETRTKKWTPLLGISVFEEAEVYSFGQQHSGKRLFCTKNHSWVVRGRDSKGNAPEKLVEAQYFSRNRPIRINAPFDNDVKSSNFTLVNQKYDYDWIAKICKLSDPELHAMMQGFLLADGCIHGGKHWTFAQAEGHLLDAFLTCFYLVSDTRISACQKRKLKGPNQRMGYNVVQTTNTWMRTKDMSLRYEGVEPVWCPSTKFGTWVMKQGDFITITGNTANIPSGAKAKYGHECRSFWGVTPNKGLVLVGYDAAGLETAGLCHYLNNPKATEILLKPKPDDVHTVNATRLTEALGRSVDREWGAKTSWYAWLYGAYPPKLGSIVRGPASDGEIVVDTFFRNVPGLKQLIDSIQYEWKSNSGRLRTIDGGFVICPSLNAALNYRVQSMGAILMKLAAIVLREQGLKQNIPFKLVGSIHDEGQLECHKEYGEALGKLAVWSIEEAGRQLNLNVPVTGDFKVGQGWHETH